MNSPFELRRKLQEALAKDSYFITITYTEKAEGKLHHYYITQRFPKEDLIPALAHFAAEIDKDEAA
jgi:hypothetical protein